MSRIVTAIAGATGITLPGGWALKGGDSVKVPDAEWDIISADPDYQLVVLDGGVSLLSPDQVPSWRDIQRDQVGGGGGGGGGVTPYVAEFTFTALSVWPMVHNLGTKAVSVFARNGAGDTLLGTRSDASDSNSVTLTFANPQTGVARVWAH